MSPRQILTAGLLSLLALGLGACSSTPSAKPGSKGGVPTRVSWRDYRVDQLLELVNESHTARLEQYSKTRTDANRKVQTDEIVAALVDHMRSGSYAKLWQAGSAPEKAGGAWLWSLEIETPSGTAFTAMPPGLAADQKLLYRDLWQAFLDTYNLTYSLQAVKVKDGETPFSAPEPPGKPKPAKQP